MPKPPWDWTDALMIAVLATCTAAPLLTAIYAYALRDPIGPHDIMCFGLPKAPEGRLKERCWHMLDPKMLAMSHAVMDCVEQEFDPYRLNPNELAAFASLAYSTGQGAAVICDPSVSTLAVFLKRRYAVPMACKQIMRWDYVSYYGNQYRMPWLTRRREAEYDLCIKPWSPEW
jgi:hypothetical protein